MSNVTNLFFKIFESPQIIFIVDFLLKENA